MDPQTPITLPKKRQTRTVVFGIRLTQTERDAIRAFAHQINFPASEMARHLVLQVIACASRKRQYRPLNVAGISA